MTSKYFRCNCGWAFHGLHIDTFDGDEFCVTVVNAPADYGLLQRIKASWAILRGHFHILSEVYLLKSDFEELVKFAQDILEEAGEEEQWREG